MFFARRNPNFKHDGNFLLARILTFKHGEIVSVRLSKTSEMSAQQGGYFVRKTIIAPNSFDQAVLEVSLTRGHRVKNASVDGGELIPVKSWKDIEGE